MGCKAVLEHLTFFVSMGDSLTRPTQLNPLKPRTMTGGTEESIKLTAASPGKVLQDPGHSCDSNSSFQQNSLKSTPARQFKANFDNA